MPINTVIPGVYVDIDSNKNASPGKKMFRTLLIVKDNKDVSEKMIASFKKNNPFGQVESVLISGDVTVIKAIENVGHLRYDIIGACDISDTELKGINDALEKRWGATEQLDGLFLTVRSYAKTALPLVAPKETPSSSTEKEPEVPRPATALVQPKEKPEDSLSKRYYCILVAGGSTNSEHEMLGALCGVISRYGEEDPARPFQTLPLLGIAGKYEEGLSRFQRDSLAKAGFSTARIAPDGTVTLENMVMMDPKDPVSMNTPLTISYLRRDQREYLEKKYSRYKLADDGTQFDVDQRVITPSILKAEFAVMVSRWERRGLIENADKFIESLVVKRDPDNPNALIYEMQPDLINQLQIMSGTISFRV